ncbi:MAG: Choline-sulfatase [Verrucomicrobia subdivision 3 bacterium]|nr:Choline-sulfatase [Limisphaerales bacterium]MCS1414646.1 Choline-sulfatase [Limisphaerales bacterium]
MLLILAFTCPCLNALEKPNVLFIAIDDLRPELGCYGQSHMITPNLDRLASEGRLFNRHYVQVPTCGASRRSLLTGRRPTKPVHLNNDAVRYAMANETTPDQPESWAHHFKKHGYRTIAYGKISHYPGGRIYKKDVGNGEGDLEMPKSWHEVGPSFGKWKTGWNAFFGYANGSGRQRETSPPFETADVTDDGYPDGLIADQAIEKLREVKDQSFLLAVGFFKPHLPFTAPKKYFDLYPLKDVALSPNPLAPVGIRKESLHQSGEVFNNYGGHPDGAKESKAYARQLRRAYFACISYIDAQVGKLLQELNRLRLSEKTIVIVWGDHGWHLGDHSLWGKHSTFERSLRSALIIRTPNILQPGVPTNSLVETVDLYPTLVELCDLPRPETSLHGKSLCPILRNPTVKTKDSALGFWKGRTTVRTETHRLVTYHDAQPDEIDEELFDHRSDPLETRNVADQHSEIVRQLRALIPAR